NSFVQGIQFLIKERIIKIPQTAQGSGSGNNQIPDWIKKNAGWWADGSIDDNSFVQGIQFLIKERIIKIPQTAQDSGSGSSEPDSWFG
ncbi:MAG: peptidase, partial [Nitrosarchaeum sp.]